MRTHLPILRLLSGGRKQKKASFRHFGSSSSIRHGLEVETEPRVEMEATSEYFKYNSGRWLYNETLRLKERFLAFDVLALQQVAAKAIHKPASEIVSFKKLAEGGFNRTFIIGMKDGREVIARLPYPIAFPRQLTVASEVATLRLVRSHGVPVPEVLDYSTTADNSVGAEYIIMDKAAGKELGDRWFLLPDLERAKLIGRLSQIENVLFSIPLPASGSIFYKRDLDKLAPSLPSLDIADTEFCVGPSVEQRWWHDRRDQLQLNNIHRGPFETAEQFLKAGAEKELSWLRRYGQPCFPKLEYRAFTNYRKSEPEEHVELLQKFLQIAPLLVPAAAQWLLKPTLRHPDLNPRNIFVDENLGISSLIDWQHCSAVPLFLQAGVPEMFANFGDEQSIRLKKPSPLSEEKLSTLSQDDQIRARELYHRRHSHFYYFGGAFKFNNIHYKALVLSSTALKQRLCFNASSPWQGNPIPLKTALVQATQSWDTLTAESASPAPAPAPASCPISFTPEEAAKCLEINAAQDQIDDQVSLLRDSLGIGEDGWVSTEHYDRAVAENERLKHDLLSGPDVSDEERRLSLQHWPFDDHVEDGSE